MIKLRQLVYESTHTQRPSKELDLFLLKNKVHKFSGTLYHGSPASGLKGMILEGIYGTEHGEISENNTFSTSINSEVLHMFSEANHDMGLEFEVKDVTLLVLDDILTKLMAELRGSGMDPEVDDEEEFKAFCEKYQIPKGKGWGRDDEYYLPYDYISSLGVDGFVYDYVWRRIDHGMPPSLRDESEIAFVTKGIKKLNHMVSQIWVDGQTFEISEKKEALAAIEEYV